MKFSSFQHLRFGRLSGVFLLLLIGSLSIAGALESITLAWDRSPSADVEGYKVYYGTTSGSLTQTLDVGNVTSAIVSNLNEATTYYFAVSAYNSADLESEHLNEVSQKTLGEVLYSLTVTGGVGDGRYPSGKQVVVTADAGPQGQQFARWDGDYVILANFLSPSTTATIPLRDVSIFATYSA
ncbi:MAG TPA: fibronectin type III domain-containing protein, partial [Terrimicrobiaceae bacterium]